jgi:hypothetical protein
VAAQQEAVRLVVAQLHGSGSAAISGGATGSGKIEKGISER